MATTVSATPLTYEAAFLAFKERVPIVEGPAADQLSDWRAGFEACVEPLPTGKSTRTPYSLTVDRPVGRYREVPQAFDLKVLGRSGLALRPPPQCAGYTLPTIYARLALAGASLDGLPVPEPEARQFADKHLASGLRGRRVEIDLDFEVEAAEVGAAGAPILWLEPLSLTVRARTREQTVLRSLGGADLRALRAQALSRLEDRASRAPLALTGQTVETLYRAMVDDRPLDPAFLLSGLLENEGLEPAAKARLRDALLNRLESHKGGVPGALTFAVDFDAHMSVGDAQESLNFPTHFRLALAPTGAKDRLVPVLGFANALDFDGQIVRAAGSAPPLIDSGQGEPATALRRGRLVVAPVSAVADPWLGGRVLMMHVHRIDLFGNQGTERLLASLPARSPKRAWQPAPDARSARDFDLAGVTTAMDRREVIGLLSHSIGAPFSPDGDGLDGPVLLFARGAGCNIRLKDNLQPRDRANRLVSGVGFRIDVPEGERCALVRFKAAGSGQGGTGLGAIGRSVLERYPSQIILVESRALNGPADQALVTVERELESRFGPPVRRRDFVRRYTQWNPPHLTQARALSWGVQLSDQRAVFQLPTEVFLPVHALEADIELFDETMVVRLTLSEGK